jgi:hypothetical protein
MRAIRVIGSFLLLLEISSRFWCITDNLKILLLPKRLLIKRVHLLGGSLLLGGLALSILISQKRASEGNNWVINFWRLDRSLVEDRIDVCRILTIVAPLILPIDDRLMLIAKSCIRWLKLLGLNWLLYLVV